MAAISASDSTLVHRANLNIAAAIMAKSGPRVPDSLIGRAIDEIRASHPVAELAGSGAMPMVVSAVETFLARHQEADRPRNLYGAEAAQAAQALGGADGLRGGSFDLGRAGSSARYRELSSGDGAKAESGSGNGNNGASVSGTGSEPAGSAFWGTAKGMMLTRAYANDNNMGWAPSDLMQMGRPALQALKESGLKGDGFKGYRDPNGLHLDNGTIVAGAGYMKRNGCNYNEAGKFSAAVDGLSMPDDMRKRHRDAVKGVLTSTPENEVERKEDLRKSGDEIVQHDPAHKAAVERERKGYKVDQKAAPKAEAKAQGKEAAAKKDDAEAKKDNDLTKKKDVLADAKDAKNDDASAKMAELLKKRQAAASTPKPSS